MQKRVLTTSKLSSHENRATVFPQIQTIFFTVDFQSSASEEPDRQMIHSSIASAIPPNKKTQAKIARVFKFKNM